MPLNKYKGFLAINGEMFPAENANSIDPDNLVAQTSGHLDGGVNMSALAIFQSLGNGANNGKIKINIDGIIYDNLAVDLKIEWGIPAVLVNQSSYNTTTGPSFNQSFTTAPGQYSITAINFYNTSNSYSSPTTVVVELWSGNVFGSGVMLASKGIGQASITNTWTFDTPIPVTPNTQYYFKFYTSGGSTVTLAYRYSTVDVYAGGVCSNGGDVLFSITGSAGVAPTTMSSIAVSLQTAIRAITGKMETVIYSVNRLIITSSTLNRASKILKLMSPSTGTDISGNNGILYLDCSANATETLGTGEEYNLVRLDKGGKLDGGLLMGKVNYVTKVNGTIYQAETDGFLLLTMANYPTIVYVDVLANPATIVYTVGQGYSGNLIPIKKGLYYKYTGINTTAKWIDWHN